jgi:hypothetical protein
VTIDGRTLSVDLRVAHPDFVPFRDSSFGSGPGERVVVLQRGSTVVVSGWIGSPATLVTELEIELDRDARLPADAWTRRPDGRLTTARIPPGAHLIRVRHASEEGPWFSEVARFELAEGGYELLELELLQACSLRGELEPSVPRPVVDGHVSVILSHGGVGQEPALNLRVEAPIAADGSFAVDGLPPGDGYVFALCRGWCSRRTRADAAEQVGLQLYRSEHDKRSEAERLEEALERMGERALAHQRVRVPRGGPALVVLMEPTGAVEVQVARTDGTPVLGATVSINPNVHVASVGSWIIRWREWSREVDSTGRVRFEDVPPHLGVWIHAHHAELQMRKVDREQRIRIAVRAGETTEARVLLEPN